MEFSKLRISGCLHAPSLYSTPLTSRGSSFSISHVLPGALGLATYPIESRRSDATSQPETARFGIANAMRDWATAALAADLHTRQHFIYSTFDTTAAWTYRYRSTSALRARIRFHTAQLHRSASTPAARHY